MCPIWFLLPAIEPRGVRGLLDKREPIAIEALGQANLIIEDPSQAAQSQRRLRPVKDRDRYLGRIVAGSIDQPIRLIRVIPQRSGPPLRQTIVVSGRQATVSAQLAEALRRQVNQVQQAVGCHSGQAVLAQVAATDYARIERIAEHFNERAEVVLGGVEGPILASRRVESV